MEKPDLKRDLLYQACDNLREELLDAVTNRTNIKARHIARVIVDGNPPLRAFGITVSDLLTACHTEIVESILRLQTVEKLLNEA